MQLDFSVISDQDFSRFRQLLHTVCGIRLSESKKALVCNKLGKHLRHTHFASFGEYYDYVTRQPEVELQTVVNLLTINETHFFREPGHFHYLTGEILPALAPEYAPRIWSAACSTGEETYSLAMIMADTLGDMDWEVLGSDINTNVLNQAAMGRYPLARAQEIPAEYLQRHCLRGIDENEGNFVIAPELREHVSFANVNLQDDFSGLGLFDVILLRNVMIYFDIVAKRDIVRRVAAQLQPGGWLMVGHAESISGLCEDLEMVAPAIYRRR